MATLRVLLLAQALRFSAAADVIALTAATFDQHITGNKHTLVEFYAPWCGHCKKLAPEYEKAALAMAPKGVPFAKVDATEEKSLSSKYNIKGFPTMVWFEDGKQMEYDGGRTSETITEWVLSMTGHAVAETTSPDEPSADKPRIVLYGDSLLTGFEEVAKVKRRKASWYFVKTPGAPKIVLQHKGEDPVQLTSNCGEKSSIEAFLADNVLPLFGHLDGSSFDRYMEGGKGIIWSLFKNPDGTPDGIERKYRPMMSEVGKAVKSKYFVTWTDTEKFTEALENMLSVTEFPAIAVQKKAGDKKKFVYDEEMTAAKIIRFVEDVDAGRVEPKLKTEPEPQSQDEDVRVVVGSTFNKEVFLPDKDVLLEVYAPWCGHCKKLEPEYIKLAQKIKKEELTDLLVIAKIDGTANDSPVDSIDWTGFPTIYYIKAGSQEANIYESERTAKGLWKYIKKHASKAQVIRERLERRMNSKKKGEEL